MIIRVYSDNTLALDVASFCGRLNRLCAQLRFEPGDRILHIADAEISCPATNINLSEAESASFDPAELAVLATHVPYTDGSYWDYSDIPDCRSLKGRGPVIVSFSGWNSLTDIPVTNGLVYFPASIIAYSLGMNQTHEKDIGCLNDRLHDKIGVGTAILAATICTRCRDSFTGDAAQLEDLRRLLDAASHASRFNAQIDESWECRATAVHPRFDVFLCYKSEDRDQVKEINSLLGIGGVRTWLDEEQIVPGEPWQEALETMISETPKAAVFISSGEIGRWQGQEIRALFNQMVEEKQRQVVPVILPNAPEALELPMFLKSLHFLDLRDRENYVKNIVRLVGLLRSR